MTSAKMTEIFECVDLKGMPSAKMTEIFECVDCGYKANKKSNYWRHTESRKH